MIRRRVFLMLCWLATGIASGPIAAADTGDGRLAIRGYDPVAYFTESRPMAGDPKHQYEWEGAVYRFASARHLALFKANPDRYAPQYGNFCTAALSRGKRVVSDPHNWLIRDGRLHLFGKPIGPGLMQKDPKGIAARAEKNWKRVSELPWEPSAPAAQTR